MPNGRQGRSSETGDRIGTGRHWARLVVAMKTLVAVVLLCGAAQVSPPSAEAPKPSGEIALTSEERSFLAGKKVRLGVDSARPPFEFIDPKGAYSGISAGFIQECARRLGVEIIIVPNLTVAQAIEKVNAGEVDIIPKVTPTVEREKHLLFTAPYVTFPSVIVTQREAKFVGGIEDLDGLKVGVLKGLVVEELMKKDYPGLPLVLMPNIKEALLQLSTGTIDAFIDNLGTVSYNIDQLGLTNLKVAAPTPFNHDLAFGVRKDMPLLKSAFDKALASLSGQERAAIKGQWLAVSYQKMVDWRVVGPSVGALGLVVLVILAWNQRLRRSIKERERIQQELKERSVALESQSRLKSHLNRIVSDLQKARTYEELAETALVQIAPLTGTAYASFHIVNEAEGLLRYVGGFGRMGHDDESQPRIVGQGLVGQCAKDNAPIDITDPEGIAVRIASGRGLLVPRELLILPIHRMEKVLGVISLATLNRFDKEQRDLLEEFSNTLALTLEILTGNLETRRLLEQSQLHAQVLADAEKKNRTILDSISVGTLLIDPESRTIVDANPVAARLIGQPREEILGRVCHGFVCPDDRDGCQVLDLGQSVENAQKVLRNAKGQDIPVLKTVAPVVLGNRHYLLESFVDISEQKVLEQKLRESGARLQIVSNAVSQSPASVMITDRQGTIEYVNPKFEELTGYLSEDVLGRNPRFLKSGVHPEEVYRQMWEAILSGREWHMELCNRKKNGDLYWENASISSVQNESGQITHFVSVREDITERKRLDEELRQHMDELERFTRLTVDREERMIELKREINALLVESGQAERYVIVD